MVRRAVGPDARTGVIAVSSLQDPRVAAYRGVGEPRLLEADGLFVVEGRLVVPRLLSLSAQPGRWSGTAHSVLLSPAAFERMRSVVSAHPDVPVFVAPQAVMDALVGFNMHRGCLALARRPAVGDLRPEALAGARQLVVLEGVNNPDNVGGIFRSAAALGGDLVVLGPGCADPLYRKAVRTSMGATLAVPYVSAAEWPQALNLLGDHGVEVVALTTARDALPLHRWRRSQPMVAWVAGAEGFGLSGEAVARAAARVTISMTGPASGAVDSLNVTIAVSLALYHGSVSGWT